MNFITVTDLQYNEKVDVNLDNVAVIYTHGTGGGIIITNAITLGEEGPISLKYSINADDLKRVKEAIRGK